MNQVGLTEMVTSQEHSGAGEGGGGPDVCPLTNAFYRKLGLRGAQRGGGVRGYCYCSVPQNTWWGWVVGGLLLL